MPTYSYRCKSCCVEFDAQQKMADSPHRKCPYCGKRALERLISAPNVIIRGVEREPPAAAQAKLKAKSDAFGAPFYPLPKEQQNGLSVLSYVGGKGIVEHKNLAGRPPGSFGKEGRIVLVKDDKKPRSDQK